MSPHPTTAPPRPSYLHLITIPTPFPVGPVNLYLAEGDPLTLIDTGPRFAPARQALREELSALGLRPSDLGRILLTHAHSDHCGLAAELVRASGAEVLTHPLNFPQLADYAEERGRRMAFYRSLMREAGVPAAVIDQVDQARRGYAQFGEAVRPDGPLEEGMTIRLGDEDWQVLHTPGHAGGLICLYQPERRLLLSSDHLLRDVSSNPIVEPPRREGEPRPRRLLDYLAQLRRVAELPVDRALPGHGPPITDVPGLVAERLTFHRQRAERVREAVRRSPCTAYEIAQALFPRLDPINCFLALSEVIGHLDWLETQGEVESRTEGGVRLWRAV